jgi:hypothetical protein
MDFFTSNNFIPLVENILLSPLGVAFLAIDFFQKSSVAGSIDYPELLRLFLLSFSLAVSGIVLVALIFLRTKKIKSLTRMTVEIIFLIFIFYVLISIISYLLLFAFGY